MSSFQASILRRSLPNKAFELLRELLQQMAQRLGEGAVVLTEDILTLGEIPSGEAAREKFTLLVSQRFSVLLLGQTRSESNDALKIQNPKYKIEVGISFSKDAIASFLTNLATQLDSNLETRLFLDKIRQTIQPNDALLQSEFTLSLLEILSLDDNSDSTAAPIYPHVSVCQPVEDALRQQVEQERLLNQVIVQIRQSLQLPMILETAVAQVRHFLQVDRLVIYQFIDTKDSGDRSANDKANLGQNAVKNNDWLMPIQETDGESLETSPVTSLPSQIKKSNSKIEGYGRITYEARADDAVLSVLHLNEGATCFRDTPSYTEKYRKGFTLAIEDIETAYEFPNCLLELMRQTQVKAKLVAPIVVQEELWGLLIAHQCFETRQWSEGEKNFLKHIAEHLAIAIDQSLVYAELQQQKQNLEQRVIERTQALHDALLAAQAASQAKSEFLATMSHELRTPLTSIIGLSDTLLRSYLGQLPTGYALSVQKQQNYLQTIHNSGQHLLGLINDILDLSQVEAGKAILNISEFSLGKLARQSIQTLAESASVKAVKLELDLKLDSVGDRFLADQNRARQILMNLLSNAIKFTPDGGQVLLRVWRENDTAVFQVEDTGIGIPEHQRSLIFQKFQQLEPLIQRTYEGTGLGLALTKQLVELHGGRIEVESTVGDGSTFTVWLPGQPALARKNSSDDQQPTTGYPHGSIVLVEEQEEVATFICDILTAAEYQVVWLMDGYAAVRQIELLMPIAVIVDRQLPGIDGLEISYSLRNSPPTQHIKVLVLTALEMLLDQQSFLAAGVDDYLAKPVQPEQLLHKIQLLMRNG